MIKKMYPSDNCVRITVIKKLHQKKGVNPSRTLSVKLGCSNRWIKEYLFKLKVDTLALLC